MELIVVGAGWAGEAHVKAIRALEAAGAAGTSLRTGRPTDVAA